AAIEHSRPVFTSAEPAQVGARDDRHARLADVEMCRCGRGFDVKAGSSVPYAQLVEVTDGVAHTRNAAVAEVVVGEAEEVEASVIGAIQEARIAGENEPVLVNFEGVHDRAFQVG